MWGIILLAAILRLTYLDLIPFRAEQVQHLIGGLEVGSGGELPQVGGRLADKMTNPPMIRYFMAVPLIWGRDPRFATVFIAILNIVALIGFYRFGERHYGLRVAIISTALFAASPWAVVFSRDISCEGILIPLSMILLQGLYVALADHRPWGWVADCLALGFILYTTLLALPLLLVMLVLAAIYHRRVHWAHAVLGGCLILVIFTPYLSYQNMHRLQDIRILLDGIQERAFQPSMILSALRFARWGHSGEQFFSLVRPSVPEVGLMLSLFKQLTRIAGLLFVISLPAIVVLSVRAWSHWKERQDAVKYVILAVWLWIPLLAACAQPGGPTPRSMAILFPAGFLALGLLLDRVTRWSGLPILRAWWCELVAVAVWCFCLLLITWNTYGVIHLYGFVAHHDTNGGYGIPYLFWRLTADLVRREVVAEDSDQIWVIAEGSDINSDEQPMLLHYLLEPEVQTVFLGRDGYECMPLPAARAGVYLLTRPSHFVEDTIQRLGGEARGLVLFPEKPAKAEVTVIGAQPVEEMLALIPSPNLHALDSGVRLLGHDQVASAKPGQTITIATYWTFADVPHRIAEAQHAWLMALQGQKGVAAVGCTGFGLPERYWEEGLLLKQWCEMDLPTDIADGDYALITGMRCISDPYLGELDVHSRTLDTPISLGSVRITP
jgi:hypothetical protein